MPMWKRDAEAEYIRSAMFTLLCRAFKHISFQLYMYIKTGIQGHAHN